MEATKPGSGKTETVKTQEIEEKPATPHGSETSSSLPKAKPVDPELTVSKEVLLTNMRLLNANGYPFTDMLTQGEHKLGLELLQAAINVAEQPMSQKSRIRKLADLATFVDGYLSHYPYFTGSKQKIFAQEMKRIATLLQTVLSEKVQDYDKSPVSTSLSADDGSSLLKLAVHVLTQDRSENLAGIRMELALKAHDFCCRFEKTADSTDESESRSTTTTMLRVLMLGMVNTFKK